MRGLAYEPAFHQCLQPGSGIMTVPVIEDLTPGQLPGRCRTLLEEGGRMQFAYAWFPEGDGPAELRYVMSPASGQEFRQWRCRPADDAVPSLAVAAPLMSWYEREMTELCGIAFADSPQPEPLVLLSGAQASKPPLVPGADASLAYRAQPYSLPELSEPSRADLQTLPFGPVRAGVAESAQFIFYYAGEAILHYYPQLFFKHRGMEKRFEGRDAALGTVLAERVSGVGSVAHALAYCQAVEAAAGAVVPPRARALRVLLAELERLYNHFHYLGHLSHTTTLKVGEAQGLYLEELAKQINGRVSGSRFLRSVLKPGGLRRDLDLGGVLDQLNRVVDEFTPYADMLLNSGPHLDRLITNGILTRQAAEDQGATGPIQRASGWDGDLRRDQPYAGYAQWPPYEIPVRQAGDASARQEVRIAEIEQSIALVKHVLAEVPDGPLAVECAPADGSEGLGWAESPRGALFYAVHVGAGGRLARVKIKSPSFSNWRVFPFTVHDTNMMDYAINEASFGLTIAGCDR